MENRSYKVRDSELKNEKTPQNGDFLCLFKGRNRSGQKGYLLKVIERLSLKQRRNSRFDGDLQTPSRVRRRQGAPGFLQFFFLH